MDKNNSVQHNTGRLIAMLFSRLFLFAFFQSVIALLCNSWVESEKYWLLTATLTNIVSIILLVNLFRREGIKFLSIFSFSKSERKKDISIFIGLAVLSVPLVLAPSFILSKLFWGNTAYYHRILFQPIPLYQIYFLLVAFPVTIAFSELATYFGFIMPRLKKNVKTKWITLLLPIFFLSIQHCTLPLVFDGKFMLLRGLMYLPFAGMLGIAINKRPGLLPYLAILHGSLDLMTVTVLLTQTNNM